MTVKNKLGLILLIVGYLLLIPGVSLPVIHVVSVLDKAALAEIGKESLMASQNIPPFIMQFVSGFIDSIQISGTEVVQETHHSILGVAETLWKDGNLFVAIMIVFFSIVIPISKGILVASSETVFKKSKEGITAKLAEKMSKWSMADVFVIALIISFLGTNATTAGSGLVQTTAEFGEGFYFFLAYCFLSIISSQLIRQEAVK